ncbi:MAG: hypothetical protein A2885_03165 [Sphingopyxis sp. RIFCSPHIGHO2_01_FULL_65_24]|nr:MAG: hypothetical protein A2885_03165 [Sphingopyxis sp. RIFCSPHIGHO2_01_FULL_65_24]
MKSMIVASSLALMSVLACAGPGEPATAAAQETGAIAWDVKPADGAGDQPVLRLRQKNSNSDIALDGARPEFGAARSALGGTGPVRFAVRHAAGSLECTGTLTAAHKGQGRCDFTPDAGFERELAARGLAPEKRGDLLAMLMVDATLTLADGLTREGVKPKDSNDLIAAAALGVTPDYVRDLKRAPLKLTEVEDAIACKALGVTGAYVRELVAAGYDTLDVEDVVGMKAMGVTGDYARAMNRATGGGQ